MKTLCHLLLLFALGTGAVHADELCSDPKEKAAATAVACRLVSSAVADIDVDELCISDADDDTVSTTTFTVASNPSASFCICRDTAGWVRCSASAARVKPP